MAANLRKYKYTGPSSTRPHKASTSSPTVLPDPKSPPPPGNLGMDAEALKSDILLSLKADISAVIKLELKNALAGDFDFIKSELQAVRGEIKSNTAAIHSEINQVRAKVSEVEDGLTTWSDEVAALQTTVTNLTAEMTGLREKCEDMEGRMRRCNVRILGVAETNGSSSTAYVSKLLREALQMDKDVLVDRSHRSLGPRRRDGRPRAIVAKLHYYQDCVEVLSRARSRAPLRVNGETIAIFPDYTANVAKARAAFTEVRKVLRNCQGVRYGILFPARLRITHNGEEKEFTDASKAMAYVKKNIVPTEEG